MILDSEKLFDRIANALQLKTAPQIARKLGLAKQSVYLWQQGNWPSIETLGEIAETSNTCLHWLLTGRGEKSLKAGEQTSEISVLDDVERESIQRLSASERKPFDEVLRELISEALAARGVLEELPHSQVVPIKLIGELTATGTLLTYPSALELMVNESSLRGYDPLHIVALRVRGEAYKDAGYLDGQTLLCHPATEANNGDLVIARHEGRLLIRFYYREAAHVRLRHRLDHAPPLYCAPHEIEILYKVIA